MPKLEALRWVPKLLNAYIDAKVEYETNRRLQEQSGEETKPSDESADPPLRPAKKHRPRLQKHTRRTAGKKKAVTSPARTFAEPGSVWLAKGTALPVGKQRQMDRLEMLRQQVAHLQKQLDRELQLLRKRV